MTRYSAILILVFFGGTFFAISQIKEEREFKIEEELFPRKAKELIEPYLKNAKHLRYYKEIDGKKVSYEAKLKKSKIKYSIEFSEKGHLEDVEFIIKKVDIPISSYETITNYLAAKHGKYRIKKIQQQYLNQEGKSTETLKAAFQNLIIPEINYELIVATKKDKGHAHYEITFNSDGEFILSRRSTNPEYDHILY